MHNSCIQLETNKCQEMVELNLHQQVRSYRGAKSNNFPIEYLNKDLCRQTVNIRLAVFNGKKDHWMIHLSGNYQFHEWLGPIRQDYDYGDHVDDYGD